jgi:hypothetical protein
MIADERELLESLAVYGITPIQYFQLRNIILEAWNVTRPNALSVDFLIQTYSVRFS